MLLHARKLAKRNVSPCVSASAPHLLWRLPVTHFSAAQRAQASRLTDAISTEIESDMGSLNGLSEKKNADRRSARPEIEQTYASLHH